MPGHMPCSTLLPSSKPTETSCWLQLSAAASRWAYARAYALQYASPELRADRDVVLASVARIGRAVQHASPKLRADRDVVLAAVARNGHALQFASPKLRGNRAVVQTAVACDSEPTEFS